MARRSNLLAQLHRDLERSRRAAQAAQKAAERAATQQRKAKEQASRELQRQAAAEEREQRRQYLDQRQAEAVAQTAIAEAEVEELRSLLVSALKIHAAISFAAYKYTLDAPPFDPGQLGVPTPIPRWEDVAPRRPGSLGRMFGGQERFEKKWALAWTEYQAELTRLASVEAQRVAQLEAREREYRAHIEQAEEVVREHNEEVEYFEEKFHAGDPDVVEGYVKELILNRSEYPEGFALRHDVAYRAESKEVVVQCELPPLSIIPSQRAYRYVRVRDEIDALSRPSKEARELYASVIAQIALRTLHEVFDAEVEDVIEMVTFNGHVTAIDKATGRSQRPCLISVSTPRERFHELVLSHVDPAECLRHINALVSPHPHDLEPVRPIVDFDLSKYRLVESLDVVGSLDSRTDLLRMNPTDFEHLVRQLFEAMGMESWNTQASKDEGVDAVAISKDPVFGGLCVIQAKRYSSVVGLEAVHALAGVMDDKRATKGILVTTSWFGKASRDFAIRHGRMDLYDGHHLKYLIKTHLGKDILISLPKPPRKWATQTGQTA